MNKLIRDWKTPFGIWIICLIAFGILGFTGDKNDPERVKFVSSTILVPIIIGFISFIIFFLIGLATLVENIQSKIMNAKKQKELANNINKWFIVIAVIALILIGQYISNNTDTKSSLGTSQTTTTIAPGSESKLIECYIDGRRIEATREDCQALSIKKTPTQPPVIIQQQAPVKVIPTFGLPRIKRTNCYWSGSSLNRVLNCTEY
ncbi:MAG: hypothetical protein WA061_03140 [Microgenomates group bacterium]